MEKEWFMIEQEKRQQYRDWYAGLNERDRNHEDDRLKRLEVYEKAQSQIVLILSLLGIIAVITFFIYDFIQ